MNTEMHNMDKPVSLDFSRRKLPHWRVAARPYFVTFRLHGTLPREVVSRLAAERAELLALHGSLDKMAEFERREFRMIEKVLDSLDNTVQHLRHPGIAQRVLDAFSFIEKEDGWRFPYIVVMPNHVHCLACGQADAARPLEKAIGALKQHTALAANRILGRRGAFWAQENFDHWCRTPEKVEAVREYIRNNAVKAGLVSDWRDWPWIKIED